jgi:hypothetical protein
MVKVYVDYVTYLGCYDDKTDVKEVVTRSKKWKENRFYSFLHKLLGKSHEIECERLEHLCTILKNGKIITNNCGRNEQVEAHVLFHRLFVKEVPLDEIRCSKEFKDKITEYFDGERIV